MLYPSSVDLVQTFDLVGDHQNRPLAIRSKLIPNDLEISERCDFRFHSLFAHNTSALSAIHSVAEGVVRPSASHPRDSTWIPANSFHARGQQINGPHVTDSELFRILQTAQKYGGAGTTRPLTIVGTSVSRQHHFRVH